jgi:transposase
VGSEAGAGSRALALEDKPSYDEVVAEAHRLDAMVRQLADRNAELTAEVARLSAMVEELRRAGKRQAAPFSKGRKENPRRPGRKAGEAYGRHGRRRPPEGEPDETVEAPLPPRCPFCGGLVDLEDWGRQWVEDIAEPKTTTTLVRVPVCRCRNCGRRSQGRHRAQVSDALGAAAAMVGPRALALAASLHYEGGLSLARTSAALARLGLKVTPGGLSHAFARMGRKAAPTYEAMKEALACSPSVSPDETGWRIGGEKAWLWVFATATMCVYHVARGRGFEQAVEVLPAGYAGVLVRDGWAPYRSYTQAAHQSCLAHWLRRCSELCESLPERHRWVPDSLKLVLKTALEARELRAAGEMADEAFAQVLSQLGASLDKLVGLRPADDDARRLLGHLRTERDAMLTFLSRDVDATNWRAEHGVRGPVVNRKTWGGNRTDAGAATLEVVSSVLRTAALQRVDPMALLGDILRSPVPVVAPLAGLTRPPP